MSTPSSTGVTFNEPQNALSILHVLVNKADSMGLSPNLQRSYNGDKEQRSELIESH